MAAAAPSSWEELPEDILGQVLLRLPSLDDRVRLRAVCRPWRAGAAARRHPRLPPPLPWLALRDGCLVDDRGSPIRCAPILRDGVFGYLAVDNLAFLVHDDGGCSLMDPLSGSTLPLTQLAAAVHRALGESRSYNHSDARKAYIKVILSSPLDSTLDPLVAVLIMEGHGLAIYTGKQYDAISICLIPDPKRTNAKRTWGPERFSDIAFLRGKLYALTPSEGLHFIELDAGHLNELETSLAFHQCIADDPKQQVIYNYGVGTGPEYLVMRYLAESGGRLLMMRRWMFYPQNARLGDHDKTSKIEVFQADLTTIPGRWIKVDSLDGQAIFIGSECSKSVLASQCAGGIQEDCIYFMHRVFDNPGREHFGPCVNPLGDSGVYNMRNGKITPLLPETMMAELQRKRQFLTWFFPADA